MHLLIFLKRQKKVSYVNKAQVFDRKKVPIKLESVLKNALYRKQPFVVAVNAAEY